MCLGVPGKIIAIPRGGEREVKDFTRIAKVDFFTLTREVNLCFVPEAQVGDYVIVHVGYAIAILDAVAAQDTLNLLDELDSQKESQT